MSDKNDTNESLEEVQAPVPSPDVEPAEPAEPAESAESAEPAESAESAESAEAKAPDKRILKAPKDSSNLMVFSGIAVFFFGATVSLVMAWHMSNKISQVDDMLSALTKRAVTMNSAISSFVELNVTLQEMGEIQGQFSDQQDLMLISVDEIKTQIPAEAAQKVAEENTEVYSKINKLEDTLGKQSQNFANVTKAMAGLSSRIDNFENRLGDVKRLTDDVDALITLERENYMEVLQRQTMLQEAQAGKQIVKVPRDPNLIFYSIKTP